MTVKALQNEYVNKLPIEERKEVWLNAWLALVSTDGLISAETVSQWADDCLTHYAERFAPPSIKVNLFEDTKDA